MRTDLSTDDLVLSGAPLSAIHTHVLGKPHKNARQGRYRERLGPDYYSFRIGDIAGAIDATRRAAEISDDASIGSNLLLSLNCDSALTPAALLEEHRRWAARCGFRPSWTLRSSANGR